MRYEARTRAKALEAGIHLGANGPVALERMHRAHLINAVLASLAANESPTMTEPLTYELVRRGLEQEAMAEAARRMQPLTNGRP